jgi:diamine N-acetyltransferase
MNIIVKLGTVADAGALAELAARTFRETYAADNRPEDMAVHVAQAFTPSQQETELANPDISTLLAEADGQLAGYAQLRSGVPPACVPGGDASVELWRFYVARDWHGRGIAQALMNTVIANAQRRGRWALWLGVWERNARARAFYSKSGFVDIGSQVFMLGRDAQTDRILTRRLSTALTNDAADER